VSLTQQRVRAFVDALASRQPTPGGGSAAALASALGASLYVMVCRIALARRSPSAARRRRVRRVCATCDRHRRALLTLIETDASVYGRLVAVQKRRQPLVVRQAQARALRAPREICERALAVLRQAPVLASVAGASLASDVAAGSALLVGGFAAAAATVAANLEAMGRDSHSQNPRPWGSRAPTTRRKSEAIRPSGSAAGGRPGGRRGAAGGRMGRVAQAGAVRRQIRHVTPWPPGRLGLWSR